MRTDREREYFFHFAVDSAVTALSHPDMSTPDHPHVEDLIHMIGGATMAVINPESRRVELAAPDNDPGPLVILPLIPSDIRRIEVKVMPPLSISRRGYGYNPYTFTKTVAADCQVAPQTTVPIITLHPKLSERTPLQTGYTLAHETDHAYLSAFPVVPNLHVHSKAVRASQEISAAVLEEAILTANDPETYALELEKVIKRYGNRDPLEKYRARGTNAYLRNVRATAFVGHLLHRIGATAGTIPTRTHIKVLSAQDLM